MNRDCDQSKTILMDEEILQKAILEQIPNAQVAIIAKREGVHFNEIVKLRLDFRDIPRIDNLWKFTSLARLDLNNNLIEKIEGLNLLVNLTWLNLSFNNIKKIEGLEALEKLEMLNLSNNKISIIENMDTLEKLTHFFIANNLIEQWDNVLYVKKFKSLFTFNLWGNPVSEKDDYKFLITVYFPNLMCLDYKLLDEKTKKEASVKYQYLLEKMRREELQKQQADEAGERQQAEAKLHTDAFVEFLNGSHLFESMFRDDPEIVTLRSVSDVAQLLETFEHQMVEVCTQLFETGLAEHKRREIEVNSFFSGQTEAVTVNQQKASQTMADFEQQHKGRMVELQQVSDPDLLKVKISHYNDEINQLCHNLMALEFQLVSQLEEIVKRFDINISEMGGSFIETVQGIFAQCRDLEDNYHEKVREIAVATLEKVAKDNLEEDMPDDVKMLFTDRDTVMDALATGHDNHMLKLNDRETQLITRVNAWKVTLIKRSQDKELKRSRTRISDIHRYVDHIREQLEELQQHHQ